MRIAVLGAGAAGCAAAAVFCQQGAEVMLYSRTPERLAAVRKRGGLEIAGDRGEGLVPITQTTTAIQEIASAEMIFVFVVANGQGDVARLLAPFVGPQHAVLLSSGSSGSLEVARIWREAGLTTLPLLGEISAPPQSARLIGPAQLKIRVFSPKRRVRLAAFPARDTPRLHKLVAAWVQVKPVAHVLDTGLNNPNFLVHPIPMLLNYAAIERSDGLLSLMNEGMTEAVLRTMDAHDRERVSLQEAVGLEPLPLDELYDELGGGPAVYRSPGEPMGLRDRVHFRFIDEDVPYGTVFMSSLGRLLGVATPINDAINTLASITRGVDYWAMGRTVQRLGLTGLPRSQLIRYLETGTPEAA